MHPGPGDDEARAVDDGWRVRSTDLQFLTSPEARGTVRRAGVVLTDHRRVQRARR